MVPELIALATQDRRPISSTPWLHLGDHPWLIAPLASRRPGLFLGDSTHWSTAGPDILGIFCRSLVHWFTLVSSHHFSILRRGVAASPYLCRPHFPDPFVERCPNRSAHTLLSSRWRPSHPSCRSRASARPAGRSTAPWRPLSMPTVQSRRSVIPETHP